MENDKKKPLLMLALAMLLLVAGSLLALLQVGMSARKSEGLHLNYNARAAVPGSSSYTADIERGAKIAQAKAASVFDDFFGGGDTYTQTASANTVPGSSDGSSDEVSGEYTPDEDAFDKYYKKHYGGGEEAPSASWSDGGGSAGFGGGGGGGGDSATSQETARSAPEGGTRKKGADAAEQATGANPETAVGGQDAGGAGYSSPKGTQAQQKNAGGSALSSPPPPLFPGQSAAEGGTPGMKGMKTGGLDGFNKNSGAAQLDGALERASAGAKSDYGAKMSGGAAATAAAGAAAGGGGAGGGGASSPVDASKDGKGAKDAKDGAAGEKDSSPVFGWWSRTGDEDSPAGPATASAKTAAKTTAKSASTDQDLLKAIVTERRNGAEDKYLTEEDSSAAPEETLLKAKAVAAPVEEKAVQEPDPEDFGKLPEARKKELKTEIHSFLKRVENKYGKMTDIEYTKCSATPDFCKEHEITQNYITMTTANGAKLVMGVKYVKDKWRRYTLDFKKPGGVKPSPAPDPEPDPVEGPGVSDENGDEDLYE